MNSKKKNALATLTATLMLATSFLPTTAYAEAMLMDPNLTIGESEMTIGESGIQEQQNISMAVPDSISGSVDPFNIGGNGQINFENIVVENTGEGYTQVLLNEFNFHSNTIECVETPITEETQGKKIHLWLVDEKGNKYALPLKGEPIDFGTVSPQEKLVLKLDGQANQYFYEWVATDFIQLSMSFSFKPDLTVAPIQNNIPLIPLEPAEPTTGTVLDPILPTEPPVEIIPDPVVPTEPPAEIIPDPVVPTEPPAEIIPE